MTELLSRLFVKDRDNTTNPNVRESYGKMAGITGIFCNLLISAFKFIVGALSGSASIVADAANNLSDAGSSIITLIGFKLSNKAPDPEHPFGHGRIEYISASVVAILIIIVGFQTLTSSFDKLLNPEYLNTGIITIIVLIFSILMKLWMCVFNKKLGNKINSSSLRATSADSLSDSVITTVVLFATLVTFIFKKSAFTLYVDPVLGILVGIFILYMGIRTVIDTIKPLLGMPPEPETVDEIEKLVLSVNGFYGIHDLIIHNYGPGRQFASLHVEVPSDCDIVECHEKVDKCESDILKSFGIEATIHMDPVDINDSFVSMLRREMSAKLHEIDSDWSLHDFRVVKGEKRTNLIFDVVVSAGIKMSDADIKEAVNKKALELDSTYVCVIKIDRNYVGNMR